MQIWKFPIVVTNEQFVKMPADAKILAVQTQNACPQIWALVEQSNPERERIIRVIGTGHPIASDPGQYIGTFQLIDGALIFHVFDGGYGV